MTGQGETTGNDRLDVVIAADDPRSPDVEWLLHRHLGFAHDNTPSGHVHALDISGLVQPDVTFYTGRAGDRVVVMAALRELDAGHGELKSMHTAEELRGGGIGRRMLLHILGEARRRGYRRISLETGTAQVFAAARSLYVATGFTACGPFGDYTDNPYSLCMTMELA
ncbi:MAG: GNAT family N-acetyltransferase [Acidimicrobiales bacterium]